MKAIWTLAIACVAFILGHSALAASGEEMWKGKPDPAEAHLGVLTGLGVLNSSAGFSLLGTASKKIVHQGFVPDINNSVSVEVEAGPLFISSTAVFFYSAHLRWDFQRDDEWTFYALGGLGGDITGASLGSHFDLYPRFGVGAFWRLNDRLLVRGELSHELIGVGVTFPF